VLSAALLRPHQKASSALKGAYRNARADALGTFGLVLATATSLLLGVHVFIPLATFLLIGMILHVAWEIVHPALETLLDSVPPWLDLEALRGDLLAIPGVAAAFQLHVRALNSAGAELSVKLYVRPEADSAAVLAAAKALLRDKPEYKIVQATIQIEPLPL